MSSRYQSTTYLSLILSLLTSQLSTSSPLPASSGQSALITTKQFTLANLASHDTSISFSFTESTTHPISSECILQWSSHHCAHPPINEAIACSSNEEDVDHRIVILRQWTSPGQFTLDLIQQPDPIEILSDSSLRPTDDDQAIRKAGFALTPETATIECGCESDCYVSTEKDEAELPWSWTTTLEAYRNVKAREGRLGSELGAQYVIMDAKTPNVVGPKIDLKRT